MNDSLRYRSALETDKEHPVAGELEYYNLPENEANISRIWKGDRFWHSENRVMIEINDVMTRIYQGIVGPKGEEGRDHIFFTPDWDKPTPNARTNTKSRNDKSKQIDLSVEEFVEQLESGKIQPHRGNGPPTLPP